jgi:cobalt-zinc-cadmium efflux system protein
MPAMDDHDHDHDHSHGHDHHGAGTSRTRRRLVVALGLGVAVMVAEVVAGWISGSLALLSDAGHMLMDVAALGLALWAQALGTRQRSPRKTFGYRRAEILAAAANGALLGATAVAVIIEAFRRIVSPHEIKAYPMLLVAAVGLFANTLGAWVLSRGGGRDLNLRAAAAHIASDAAGSLAAVLAAVLILTRGWTMADPITSILISVLILFGSWRLLREATHVLMEGAPTGVDVSQLERVARETPGVRDVHDLHVWSIVGDAPVITAHVVLESGAHGVEVSRDVGRRLEECAGRVHVTVQPEAPSPSDVLIPAVELKRPRE